MKNIKKLNPFGKFCCTIGNLPTSYMESLTYEEQLLWFCDFLERTVIPTVNNNAEAVEELQNFVAYYFDNLDVQEEINKKLDNMATDGTLSNLIGSYIQPRIDSQNERIELLEDEISAMASGSPAGVYATISALQVADPDHSRIYVVEADGEWYFWNNATNQWKNGGTYQATQIANNTIKFSMLNTEVKDNLDNRINNKDNIVSGSINKLDLHNKLTRYNLQPTGQHSTVETQNYASTKEFLYIPKGSYLSFENTVSETSLVGHIYFYDKDLTFIRTINMLFANNMKVTGIVIPENAVYFKLMFGVTNQTRNITYDDIYAININVKYNDNNIKYTIGNNLIDVNDIVGHYTMPSSQGQLAKDNNYNLSRIKLEAGETYTINKFIQLMIVSEEDNSILRYIGTSTNNFTYTATQNSYAFIVYSNTQKSSIMMNKGSEALPYEPYKVYLPSNIDLSNVITINPDLLLNKKYVALGDSFTHGDFTNSPTQDYTYTTGKYTGEYKVYPFIIGTKNNMEVINKAVNGLKVSGITNQMLSTIPNDVNYITIKIGINDNHQNTPIGSISDTTDSTFYGSYNRVMTYLINNYPNAKIGIIVSNAISDINYINATINIARKYGVSYLNEANDEHVPLLISTIRTDVDSSIRSLRDHQWQVLYGTNSHPNVKCHEYEATIIENFIRSL